MLPSVAVYYYPVGHDPRIGLLDQEAIGRELQYMTPVRLIHASALQLNRYDCTALVSDYVVGLA